MKTTSILKNKIILLFIFVLVLQSCATKVPFSSIDEIETITINNRTDSRFFIPKESYKPLNVRVNMIFLLDENGEGNFNGKNKEDNEILKIIFNKTNNLYANLVDPKDPNCYKGDDFIKDTKIQFLFNPIYIKDTFARNYRNSKRFNLKKRGIGPIVPSNNWYLKYLDNNINDTISKKGINAFFNMDVVAYNDVKYNKSSKEWDKTVSASVSQFPSYTDFTRSSQICFPNKYTKRIWMENVYSVQHKVSWKNKVKKWYYETYRGIAHEIGHSLSLAHSNKHSAYNKCPNAMMYQGYKSKNNYIQPSEIGKMHKALMTSSLIQYVEENANYDVPKIISENENWDFKTIRFYQDIIVEEGRILILNGKVILPPNASILLKKEAILVLNNTTLITATNEPFTNIIKSKNAKIIKY
jgi:hypothetical protein